jgi:hypothetical protein
MPDALGNGSENDNKKLVIAMNPPMRMKKQSDVLDRHDA